MKKLICVLLLLFLGVAALAGCVKPPRDTRGTAWTAFAADLPAAADIFESREAALLAGGGWYYTVDEEFEQSSAAELLFDPVTNPNSIWTHSPHDIRWKPDGEDGKVFDAWQDKNKPNANWWCADMIEVANGNVIIKSEQRTSKNPHSCSAGICPSVGRFTSGIETRSIRDGYLFAQAYGYYECRVKLPDTNGMWSAFWLQSNTMPNVGNDGRDGTEIDVYESAFRNVNRGGKSYMGHALLWDGYASAGRVADARLRLGYDLYDGKYHTFALKWTPTHYVFYVDGVATWATDAGGVSAAEEFVRLTCEIDAGDGWGPHGMKIGKFAPKKGEDTNFYIDYVKVMQHTGFER